MTIDPRELPARRRTGARRVGQAAAELAPLLDGPVHPPYTVDAAVELAVDPAVATVPRLVAVVGATSTADVAATVAWAAAGGIGVVAIDPRPHRPGPPGPTTERARPVVAVSLTRLDRVAVDAAARSVRVGVGATWSAVHRAVAGDGGAPRPLARRPGTVAHGTGSVARRGVVLVTGDGAAHRLGDGEGDPDLWWACRTCPGGIGIVTEMVLDPWATVPMPRRPAHGAEDRARLAALRLRHDPFDTLTRSVGETG